MRYDHILSEILTTPWAILPEFMATIAEILVRRIAGRPLTDEEIEARVAAGQVRTAARGAGGRVGSIAVMPILGALLPRVEAMNTSGAVSTQSLMASFDALVADDGVAAIVLDVDSPGGSVGGVEEFAVKVKEAVTRKPVVAVANPMMASAAYWIGSQAGELVASPSSVVGSVGVYSAHEDISGMLEKEGIKITLVSAGKNKTLGNPLEPLSDEGRAEIQRRVDEFGDMFVRAVARGRAVAQRTVLSTFGEGLLFGAEEAVKRGMADRVGTLQDAITLAAKRAGMKRQTVGADTADFRLTMAERGI